MVATKTPLARLLEPVGLRPDVCKGHSTDLRAEGPRKRLRLRPIGHARSGMFGPDRSWRAGAPDPLSLTDDGVGDPGGSGRDVGTDRARPEWVETE